MSQCYSSCEIMVGATIGRGPKDYARPLHVDCSVEYELPNAAKPPAGAKTEPLLMIHPCYYRRAESQRRSPFVNNLPGRGSGTSGANRKTTQGTRLAPPRSLCPSKPGERSGVSKPVRSAGKRDPLLCGGGDFSSGSDSGISAGHWTDSDRSPAGPESRLQRDFLCGPDSGIVTPASLAAEDEIPTSERRSSGNRRAFSYRRTPCSCGKTRCELPSYDPFESVALVDPENRYPPRSREQTAYQTYRLSRYGRVQLQQWLQSVRLGLSPRRKRIVPAPPGIPSYGTASPIVIH